MSRKQNKKNAKKAVINFIIYLLLFSLLIFSGFKICMWYIDNKNNKKITAQISEAVVIQENKPEEEKYNIDFEKLKEQNEDVIAWIKVEDTDIEYPIVQTKDNEYYLTHSFDKSQNDAGWIFADYRNKFDGTDKNIVIYGHNRKDGSMFSTLHNFLDEDWLNSDRKVKIIFITEDETEIYEVFSVYEIKKENYYINTTFQNDNQLTKFLNTIQKRSKKEFNVEVSKEDTILTLSTCSDKRGYRVVTHARKVKGEN